MNNQEPPQTQLNQVLEQYIEFAKENKGIDFNIDESTVHIYRQALIKMGKKHVLTAFLDGVKKEEDHEKEIDKIIDEVDERFPFTKKAESVRELIEMMAKEDKKKKDDEKRAMQMYVFPEKNPIERRLKIEKLKEDQKRYKENPHFKKEIFYSEQELEQKLQEEREKTFDGCENELGDIKEDLLKDVEGLEKDAKNITNKILEFQKEHNDLVNSFKDDDEEIRRMEQLNERLYEIYNVGERKKSFSEADIKKLMNFV